MNAGRGVVRMAERDPEVAGPAFSRRERSERIAQRFLSGVFFLPQGS